MRLTDGLLTTTLLAATFCAAPANAQEGPIQHTIRRQIDAFLADDLTRAFSFASPAIRRLFGSAETFGSMVRQGFPMVYHPDSVRMLDLRTEGGALWQKVMITDSLGRTHMLDYQMIETPEGWQINAVQLLPSPEVGA